MKKVNVNGWAGFYLNKRKFIVTIGSSVRIYSEELECIKKFNTIKYPFSTVVDSAQSKLYVGTTTNHLYCIDLDTMEIVKRKRISIENKEKDEFELCAIKLSIDETWMFLLVQEQGKALALKYDLKKDVTEILFTNEFLKYSFGLNCVQIINSNMVLLEDEYDTLFAGSERKFLRETFFLKPECIHKESRAVLFKLRNQDDIPIPVLCISENGEYCLIDEPGEKFSILDDSFNRVYTVERDKIDAYRIKYDSKNNILMISVFCARPPQMILLNLKGESVQGVRCEKAYDCIFREDNVILLTDRGKSNLLKYEELFVSM